MVIDIAWYAADFLRKLKGEDMPKKDDGFKSFWFSPDIASTIELFYNPKTDQFKEVKVFDSSDYGDVTRICTDYELSEDQQIAFFAEFPECSDKDLEI